MALKIFREKQRGDELVNLFKAFLVEREEERRKKEMAEMQIAQWPELQSVTYAISNCTIARSANSGISALINAKGEIMKQLPYGEKGVLTGSIFSRKEMTFYIKYDDILNRWALFIFGLLSLTAISGRLKRL